MNSFARATFTHRGLSLLRPTCLLALAFFAVSSLASAQGDPLKPSYAPAIDTNAADYPSNIWITDSLTKVLQDKGVPGTNHWAMLYATQNEVQSFQVHIQAPAAGYSSLTVTMSNLVQSSPSSFTISASSTDIIVYLEKYVNVTSQTATSPTHLGVTGHIPDILVPAIDPYFHQTTNAFPATVAPNQNQSVWIDVHIPPSAPSGYYQGSITVKNGSTTLATMPVVYEVWQWPVSNGGQMPSTATLHSTVGTSYEGGCDQMFGSLSACNYNGAGGDGATTWVQHDASVLVLDHRYTNGLMNVYPCVSGGSCGSFSNWDSVYAHFLNGTDSHIKQILTGAKWTEFGMWFTSNGITNVPNNAAAWPAFQNHFKSNGWSGLFYYLCDEPPNGCSWSQIQTYGNDAHSYTSPVVPNLVTVDYPNASASNILNQVDIMVPNIRYLEGRPSEGGLQNLSNYTNWLAGNASVRQWWSYLACDSSGTCSDGVVGPSYATWPNYDVDGVPVANRVMEWLTFLHGQTGELYFFADICASNNGSTCGGAHNPIANNYYSGGWGAGTLIYYSGVNLNVGTAIPIVLPSVRLKHIRDGMQDYEYLYALKNAGQSPFVQTQISSWITNSLTYETTGSGLVAARRALGTKLHQLTYPEVVLPSPSLTGTLQ